MLKQVAQAGRQHHQQQHDEDGSAHHRPLACQHFGQCGGGAGVAGEFEQAHQPEHPQKAQVEQVVQKGFQEKRQDGQQVHQQGRRLGMSQPAAQGFLKAGLLNTAVKAGAVFKRKNRHHHDVQQDELQVHHVTDALHGFKDDSGHRDQHTDHDEVVKQLVQLAAEFAGVDQGMDFLAEAAALVQAFELLPGRDEHAKQFENP